MNEFVELHLDKTIATLILSRPPTNTLTRQMFREITTVAQDISTRHNLTAVVLFGGHEIFSAGLDHEEVMNLTSTELPTLITERTRAFSALATINKPTVAAITGYALGSGLGLALTADCRISGDNVKFSTSEPQIDLLPDQETLKRLINLTGQTAARELIFSGRFIDAQHGLDTGLITSMVAPDEVYSAAHYWAHQFDNRPPELLAQAKTLFTKHIA